MTQNLVSRVVSGLVSMWNILEQFCIESYSWKNCEYWQLLFMIFDILWIGGIETVCAQKIACIKLMKFTRFFVCNFLGPNCFDTLNSYTTFVVTLLPWNNLSFDH